MKGEEDGGSALRDGELGLLDGAVEVLLNAKEGRLESAISLAGDARGNDPGRMRVQSDNRIENVEEKRWERKPYFLMSSSWGSESLNRRTYSASTRTIWYFILGKDERGRRQMRERNEPEVRAVGFLGKGGILANEGAEELAVGEEVLVDEEEGGDEAVHVPDSAQRG